MTVYTHYMLAKSWAREAADWELWLSALVLRGCDIYWRGRLMEHRAATLAELERRGYR